MNRYRTQLIIIGLVAALVVTCGLGESFIEERRADALLQLLKSVDIGAAPSSTLSSDLESFKDYRSSAGSQSGRSYDQFVFQNRGFALLALAPAKVLSIQIDFKDGIVVEKSAHFAEAPNRGAVISEGTAIDSSQINDGQIQPPVARRIEERGVFTEPTYVLSVSDSLAVPEDRRQMDWAFDISCMVRSGPCGDFRMVLRGAFK